MIWLLCFVIATLGLGVLLFIKLDAAQTAEQKMSTGFLCLAAAGAGIVGTLVLAVWLVLKVALI